MSERKTENSLVMLSAGSPEDEREGWKEGGGWFNEFCPPYRFSLP